MVGGSKGIFSTVVGTSKGYNFGYNPAIHYFERARPDMAITVINSQDGNPLQMVQSLNVINAVYNGDSVTKTVHKVSNLQAGKEFIYRQVFHITSSQTIQYLSLTTH